MTTLVEFLDPLRGGPQRIQVLAALLYADTFEGTKELSASSIRDLLSRAGIRRANKINISDVLGRAAPHAHRPRAGVWALTDTGRQHMRETLGIASNPAPANRHNGSDADIHALEQVVATIVDEGTRDYLEEAVRCLRADARRACIVFAWTGAIRVIHDQLLKAGNAALNAAIQKHDARARPVSTMDHFAYIKDKTTLLAAQELGIFDKSEKDTLEENLGLRNRCGHPGKYQPREKKVASFIEDLVTIVF